MLLAAAMAGSLLALLIARDWRLYGVGAVAACAAAWIAPAAIGYAFAPDVRPGVVVMWGIASLVSLGHPADWTLIMDADHLPAGLSRRQRWNANGSPWLVIASIVGFVAYQYWSEGW